MRLFAHVQHVAERKFELNSNADSRSIEFRQVLRTLHGSENKQQTTGNFTRASNNSKRSVVQYKPPMATQTAIKYALKNTTKTIGPLFSKGK